MDNDFIQHYGVLGMKWGIRKADKKGVSYTYKSRGQKRTEKKLEKQKKKGAPAGKIRISENKLEQYKTRDRHRQNYAETATFGKSVAKGLLMGPFGSGNYNRLRASGHTRLASYMNSNWMVSTLTLPYQIIYSRDEEFMNANR